ncbi:hypothetical protein GCM10010435_09450 [Winogradskya consettensis]|uniref:Uncharacterized protein n=1 Tax=Winogradskya consettensis TaxID=113560 RepID=A0A919SXN8_9ACTN|nr:hypothetical protein [Actinoplanes consettensis]GIM80700.1 hypothetical protein Aco04nite_72170 [Actinoplanes consettensis]
MLKDTLARGLLVAGLLTGLTACTSDSDPIADKPTAASSASTGGSAAGGKATCRTDLDEPKTGLLTVEQIWPTTTSIVNGYAAASYDAAACAALGPPLTTPQPVDCTGSFPWISAKPEQSDAIFGTTGVERSYTATVRGSDAKPAGQVVTPLEVRELALTLEGNNQAAKHPVVQAAAQCAKPVRGLPFTAYRTEIDSQDINTPITAFLAVTSDKLIWLEFDEQGWTESAYTRVLELAVADAAKL